MGRDRLLIERARQMRREPTEAEKRLWRHLSNSRLGGYKFRRQATIEPFIADFLCPAKALVVEVDGETHKTEADARRDAILSRRGFTTIRFTNREIMTNMEGALTIILNMLQRLPDRSWGMFDSPTPTPPLKGRGLSQS